MHVGVVRQLCFQESQFGLIAGLFYATDIVVYHRAYELVCDEAVEHFGESL